MNYFKILFSVLLCLFLCTNSFAQQKRPKHIQKIYDRTDEMASIMSLDDEKKAKILEIKLATEAERVTKINKQYEKGTDVYNAAIKDLYRRNTNKMKAEVTPEQWKQWQTRPKKANGFQASL